MLLCAACLCLGQFVWKIMPGYNLLYMLSGFAIYAIGALSMIFAYRYRKKTSPSLKPWD